MKWAADVGGAHIKGTMPAAIAKAGNRALTHLNGSDGRRAEEQRLIPFSVVRHLTALSRSTIWRLERQGSFPKRRRISHRRVAWASVEVRDWAHARSSDGCSPGDRPERARP